MSSARNMILLEGAAVGDAWVRWRPESAGGGAQVRFWLQVARSGAAGAVDVFLCAVESVDVEVIRLLEQRISDGVRMSVSAVARQCGGDRVAEDQPGVIFVVRDCRIGARSEQAAAVVAVESVARRGKCAAAHDVDFLAGDQQSSGGIY